MKKNINTYNDLLVYLASSGDCTAFHGLVLPYLVKYYTKLIDNGMTHADASDKVGSVGVSLFKGFIGSGVDNFDSWIKSTGDKYITDDNSEADFLQSKISQKDPVLFSKELLLQLQRYHTSQPHKHFKKNRFLRGILNNRIFFFVSILLISIILIATSYYLFSTTSVKILFVNKKTGEVIGSDKKSMQQDTVSLVQKAAIPDTVKKDTLSTDIAKKADTVPKIKHRIVRKATPPDPEFIQNTGSANLDNFSSANPVSNSGSVRTSETFSKSIRTNETFSTPPSSNTLPAAEMSGSKNSFQQQSLPPADTGSQMIR